MGALHPFPTMAYLQIENLQKRYAAQPVLSDVSLDIEQGEFVVLLGPSGCGKTTLLRVVAGLEQQCSGRVVCKGRDISHLPPSERDYGIVFQSYALFPNLTVAENIAYGIHGNGSEKIARKQRVGQMLELVGLPGLDHRYPAQLSGGQQQRIAIARALATAPGLLLLDEPLSALDAIERVRLRTEIHRLQKRLGVTTIMVTHDQEEALAVADRIIVMNAGRIEQSGTPVEIYQHPSTGFVAGFVGRMNHIDALASSEHQARCQALLLECVEPMRPGQSYRFGIRPEDIELLPGFGDQPGDAAHEAQVQKVEYLGALSVVSVLLAAAGSLELHVQVDSRRLLETPLLPGARIRVRLDPRKTHFLGPVSPAQPVRFH